MFTLPNHLQSLKIKSVTSHTPVVETPSQNGLACSILPLHSVGKQPLGWMVTCPDLSSSGVSCSPPRRAVPELAMLDSKGSCLLCSLEPPLSLTDPSGQELPSRLPCDKP